MDGDSIVYLKITDGSSFDGNPEDGKISDPGGILVTEQETTPSTTTPSQPTAQTSEPPTDKKQGGGCLIATAAFGSEMSPQVQMLRETRDNIVMQTKSGAVFMTGFNSVYYAFAPIVADWERQNPVFKEVVKIAITPLITTLSILNYVDIHSEAEMLGYGIGVIALNVGMYFIAPVFIIMKIRKII